MESSKYAIRRGDDHLPDLPVVELRVHGGQTLKVERGQPYDVTLSDEQAKSLAADGYVLEQASGRLPAWTLATPPAEYLAQHEGDVEPSARVRENLMLAQRHVARDKE